MFERFSREARDVVVRAQDEANKLGHDWIGTEHLLLAALHHPEQPGAATLARLGVTPASCRAAVAGVLPGAGEGLGPQDAEALRAFGIDLEEVRRRADESFGEGALDAAPGSGRTKRGRGRAAGPVTRHVPFAARAKKVLKQALREAVARKDRGIGVEHVVLGMLRCEDNISLAVFSRLGIEPGVVRELVLDDLRSAA
ncbi:MULTISPECIES: Clp protease N-terminal domain-containing protein [Streptomyces]|uniref:Clp protease N-terminal domain-containing protein n=1 Tax=Streptomyces TaxID=1883 RepID=UPI001B3770F3|nr:MULTISPECIES: Clp protease N-terminal domain-containing protein [unclassified Streptomyces]MBQ0863250.1 peptidase [Streptomyces sp. RK75]MBQ1122781.1 peptidase [Streptomyces sp. B15]